MKTETAFTPGPWRTLANAYIGQWQVLSEDRRVATVSIRSKEFSESMRAMPSLDSEAAANARLIAEAPAMFEALTLLVSQFDECKLEFADYPAIANAKAILERIGGQQ